MKSLSVARRYAKALYQIAGETKAVQDVATGMDNLSHALKEATGLERFLLNPLVSIEDKQALVGQVTSNKIILKFIGLLAKRNRLDLLTLIHTEFQRLSDETQDIKRVLVKTPAALTDAQKKTIEQDLAKTFGGHILGRFEVATDLIGGVWLKMGDRVLDASLKGRLEDLRHTLVHSIN